MKTLILVMYLSEIFHISFESLTLLRPVPLYISFESLTLLRPVPPQLFFSIQLPLCFFPGRRIAEAEIYLLTAKVSVGKKIS